MFTTRIAEPRDAADVSALLHANTADNGGMLLGDWSQDVIDKRIADGQTIIVAIDDGRLLGALLTQDKTYGFAPPVDAMLAAWPGSPDAYVYGPVCVAADARGRDVLAAMYEQLKSVHPGREAILFIRGDNQRSLKAHLNLGMREVARYRLNDEDFLVLSDRPQQLP